MVHRMPQSPNNSKGEEQLVQGLKKKRRDTPNKPRPPARPYKRLDENVLDLRINELSKKLNVIRSKTVLLEDRKEAHDKEKMIRLDNAVV